MLFRGGGSRHSGPLCRASPHLTNSAEAELEWLLPKAMSEEFRASRFPSFYSNSLDVDPFTCIHPSKNKGYPRCKNPVNYADRVEAAALRKALLSLSVEEGQLVQNLQRYAELCCCKRSHRGDAKELGVYRRVAIEWFADLDRHKCQLSGIESGVTRKAAVANDKMELIQSPSSHSVTPISMKHISPCPRETPPATATAVGRRSPSTPSNSMFSSLGTEGRSGSFEDASRKEDVPGQPLDEVVLGTVARPMAQETAAEPPRFIPYKSRRNEVLDQVVPLPLTSLESGNGTLYMYRRETDPGFLKIGYTTLVADDRFAWIEILCGYAPIPLRQIRRVPRIKRVERLVHIELMQYRRKCTTCQLNPDCETVHIEWFEVDEAMAMGVMDRWTEWMVEAEPYGADDRLSKEWMQICVNLKASGELPTSANLLEAMKNLREQQVSHPLAVAAVGGREHLVNLFSELKIATKFLESKPFEQQDPAGDTVDQHEHAAISMLED